MRELAMQLNSSGIIGASSIFDIVESADQHIPAIYNDPRPPFSSPLVDRHSLKSRGSAHLRPLVAEIFSMSAKSKVGPAVVETIAIYMVNVNAFWRRDYVSMEMDGTITDSGHRIVKPVPCPVETPGVFSDVLHVGSVNNRKGSPSQWDSGCAISVVDNIPAPRISIAGGAAKLPVDSTRIDEEGGLTMFTGFTNGILGAHMNHLSCAMPPVAPTTRGLSVPSIIPKPAPIRAVC